MACSFSPSTCLALIDVLPDALVNLEYQRLKDLVPVHPPTPVRSTPGTKSRPKISLAGKRDYIRKVLVDSSSSEISKKHDEERELVSVLRELSNKIREPPVRHEMGTSTDMICMNTVSTSVNEVDLGGGSLPCADSTPCPHSPTVAPSSLPPVVPPQVVPQLPCPPISVSNVKHQLNFDDVMEELNMGQRHTIHFHRSGPFVKARGSVEFPSPLPVALEAACGVSLSIDADFVPVEYSCEIVRLASGSRSVNLDGLASPSAPTYSLIVGGSCRLECLNNSGPLRPFTLDLKGGDVLVTPIPSVGNLSMNFSVISGPLLIINFKKPRPLRSAPKPPPLGLPGSSSNPKRDLLLGRSASRCLFLSDSILKSVDTSSLNLSRNNRCIKKTSYYLTDFKNFEDELEYTKTLIVSGGINDLLRLKLTPEQICDVVVPQLRRLSERFPNTSFIFNSILLTSCPRINEHVHRLNRYLAEAIGPIPNAHFFNSHRILLNSNLTSVYTDRRGIGIHVNNRAVTLIRRGLIEFLKSIGRGNFRYR